MSGKLKIKGDVMKVCQFRSGLDMRASTNHSWQATKMEPILKKAQTKAKL